MTGSLVDLVDLADWRARRTRPPDPATREAAHAGRRRGPAAGTSLTEALPSSVRFLSAGTTAGSCSRSGLVVTCGLGTLDSGGSATVTITVRPKQARTIANTAQVTSPQPDPDLANNTDTETTTVTKMKP